MDFIEGGVTLSEDLNFEPGGNHLAENISIVEYSDLQLTRYLSGSNDRNLTNYITKNNQIFAIDNDGDPVQISNFPGWPFVLIHSWDSKKTIKIEVYFKPT